MRRAICGRQPSDNKTDDAKIEAAASSSGDSDASAATAAGARTRQTNQFYDDLSHATAAADESLVELIAELVAELGKDGESPQARTLAVNLCWFFIFSLRRVCCEQRNVARAWSSRACSRHSTPDSSTSPLPLRPR